MVSFSLKQDTKHATIEYRETHSHRRLDRRFAWSPPFYLGTIHNTQTHTHTHTFTLHQMEMTVKQCNDTQ